MNGTDCIGPWRGGDRGRVAMIDALTARAVRYRKMADDCRERGDVSGSLELMAKAMLELARAMRLDALKRDD